MPRLSETIFVRYRQQKAMEEICEMAGHEWQERLLNGMNSAAFYAERACTRCGHARSRRFLLTYEEMRSLLSVRELLSLQYVEKKAGRFQSLKQLMGVLASKVRRG